MEDGAARDSGEDALTLEEGVHACDRLLVGDEQLPVELRHVEDWRDVAVVERAEPHHRVAGQRLGSCDHDVREALAHPPAGAHQRAAGAEPGHEHVNAIERRGDLGAGALVVRARIRLVRILERHEETRLALGELEREADGAVRALLSGRFDDRRAVHAQQPPSLLCRVLGKSARERVALELRDERERDSGVPRGRLE